jgi:hypothetical protein
MLTLLFPFSHYYANWLPHASMSRSTPNLNGSKRIWSMVDGRGWSDAGPRFGRLIDEPAAAHNYFSTGPPPLNCLCYGYEDLPRMCGSFIGAVFSCPNIPLFANGALPGGAACSSLAHLITCAIPSNALKKVCHSLLFYFARRLKKRLPVARGSSGHRLSSLPSKVICDDTYSTKSWRIVGYISTAPRRFSR